MGSLPDGLSSSGVKMDYDNILLELGEFGRWQQMNALILWIPAVAGGMNILIASLAVLGPTKGYRCSSECDDASGDFNFDAFPLGDLLPSFDNKSGAYNPDEPDYCTRYVGTLEKGICTHKNNETVPCKSGDAFAYEPFEMHKTVATHNNLVCEKDYWVPIIDTFMMCGFLIGSFVFGIMSDKIGRRHTLLIAMVTMITGNLICVAFDDQWGYSFPRMIGSAGEEGVFVLSFTMSLEYSGVREHIPGFSWVTYSTVLANFISIPFAIGESLPVFYAMGLKDWKIFQSAVSATMALACIVWFLLPESPRWLIATGKYEEAKKMIEKAAEKNNVKLSPDVFTAKGSENKEGEEADSRMPQYGIMDMFRPSQLKITLVMFICWPVVTLLYYGLSLSADKIKMTDNFYLSFILVCLVEIPPYLALPFIIDYWGRKPLFAVTQLVPGLCCMAAAFLTPGSAGFAILALGAKMGASAAFNVTFMYTAQLFPTSIRNTAVGICSTVARFGAIMAPWVGKYLPDQGSLPPKLPMLLFGGFGVFGGLCALLLPDTLGFPLPNTFDDIEEIKKNGKPMWQCGVKEKKKEEA